MPSAGIVPGDAAIAIGRVVIRHLVDDFGVGLERHEAVREADGYQQHRTVGRRDFRRDVLAIGR